MSGIRCGGLLYPATCVNVHLADAILAISAIHANAWASTRVEEDDKVSDSANVELCPSSTARDKSHGRSSEVDKSNRVGRHFAQDVILGQEPYFQSVPGPSSKSQPTQKQHYPECQVEDGVGKLPVS